MVDGGHEAGLRAGRVGVLVDVAAVVQQDLPRVGGLRQRAVLAVGPRAAQRHGHAVAVERGSSTGAVIEPVGAELPTVMVTVSESELPLPSNTVSVAV